VVIVESLIRICGIVICDIRTTEGVIWTTGDLVGIEILMIDAHHVVIISMTSLNLEGAPGRGIIEGEMTEEETTENLVDENLAVVTIRTLATVMGITSLEVVHNRNAVQQRIITINARKKGYYQVITLL
jgi:hypothetical protein